MGTLVPHPQQEFITKFVIISYRDILRAVITT